MTEAVFKKKIRYPQYSQLKQRLDSYPKRQSHSYIFCAKKELSEAGFFHTGREDETICYYCGGGLKDWIDTDGPWEEHARWFGRCPYVIINKGQCFVDEYYNKKAKNKIEVLEESVKKVRECIVCLTSERNILFLPCKHCCTCSSCGLMFDNCVFCREPITSIMNIYLV